MNELPVWHQMFDYFRVVAYVSIVLTSLRNIANRKFNNLLFLGDIVMALGLVLASLNFAMGEVFRQEIVVDAVLTPVSIFWAAVHFREMLRENGLTKVSYKSSIRKEDKK